MKPLSLEFAGLNSYRERQYIDFALLAEQGLFGIFGATGAGKSTILDAITLALYGEVERAANKTRGIINIREQSCFVSFAFQLGAHHYQAERVYERKKDDPFSARVKSCRLVLDGQTVLADKSEDMGREVAQLLGMDRSRFCQTVILPQGKFDKLLTMAPAERSAMLEELFHFSAYGEALLRKLRQRIKANSQELQGLEEQRKLLGDCSEAAISALRQQTEALRQALQQQAVAVTAAREQLRLSQVAAEQAGELAAAEQELARLAEQQPEMAAAQAQAEAAQQAEKLRGPLQEAVALHQQYQGAEQQLRAAYLEAWAIAKQQRQAVAEADQAARKHDLPAEAQRQAELAQRLAARVEAAKAGGQEHLLEEKRCYERWQQAEAQAETQRQHSAAAYLAATLQPGQPCPVCGSLEHQPDFCQADEQALAEAAEQAKQAKEQWLQQSKLRENQQADLLQLQQQAEQARSQAEQARDKAERQQAELAEAKRRLEQELAELAALTAPQQQGPEREIYAELQLAGEQTAAKQGQLSAAKLQLAQAMAAFEQAAQHLRAIQQQLSAGVAAAGFSSGNEAKKALLPPEQTAALWEKVRQHQQQTQLHQQQAARWRAQLTDYDPAQRQQAEQQAAQAEAMQNRLYAELGSAEARLAQAEQARTVDRELAARQQQAMEQGQLLKRLNDLLKGNAFVRYLAHGSLLDLAHEAAHILASLTNGRYSLELVEDSRGSDFIMADQHNGGLRRPVNGLSGGETFLVSLALALALSRKIEMLSAPLGFFFLDEGFGSLDEIALEAALSVLERLPSDQRSVGVITHVQGMRERLPRYLLVSCEAGQGSRVEMKIN